MVELSFINLNGLEVKSTTLSPKIKFLINKAYEVVLQHVTYLASHVKLAIDFYFHFPWYGTAY